MASSKLWKALNTNDIAECSLAIVHLVHSDMYNITLMTRIIMMTMMIRLIVIIMITRNDDDADNSSNNIDNNICMIICIIYNIYII